VGAFEIGMLVMAAIGPSRKTFRILRRDACGELAVTPASA
jgi:hypothetical protein